MIETINRKNIDDSTSVKLPLVVEILGPAGAGKSTLARALNRHDNKILQDIPLSKRDKIPYFVGNTIQMLPTYLGQYRHTNWFDWRETRSMAYLRAALTAIEKKSSNHETVILLDHGPIYRLTFLRDFGPEITTSEIFKRWWSRLLKQWIATLDMVIWLDAPNDVLLQRIRSRKQIHTIKQKSEKEAFEYLDSYRDSFEQLIAESGAERDMTLIRFDTDRESVSQIVDEVLPNFNFAP